MPSPFPGMDPWLESPATFPDLHTSLATYLRAALTKVLPRPFYAAVATRTPDAGAVAVDLQTVFARCYEEAAYELRAHYKDPSDPPLTADQQAWADGVLRARGLRD